MSEAKTFLENVMDIYNETDTFGTFVLKNGMAVKINSNFDKMNEEWHVFKDTKLIGGRTFKKFIENGGGVVTNGFIFLDPQSIDFSVAEHRISQ